MSDDGVQNSNATSLKEPVLAALLPVALLLPFINKAIHIDDTVYILVAQQIVQSPVDYFGFQMNWTGEMGWVHEFNKNPPGLSYYLAAWGLIFGWSEIAMHAAMLIPTALSSLGIYRLAERLCGRPMLATVLAVCTPGFLVSCSNVMCEPAMLTCYVWAIVWWMRGLESGKRGYLAAGALLIGIGTLVKFVAFTALPLLVAYTIWKERRVSMHLLWFLLPGAMLLLYDAASWALYDKSFMRDIVQYSTFHTSHSSRGPLLRTSLVTLAFVGGLYLPVVLAGLWSESKRMLLCIGAGTLAFVFFPFVTAGIDDSYAMYDGTAVLWGFLTQQVAFTMAGVYVFVLGVLQFRKEPGAESALLCLLIGGIFVFGGFVNWTINARALLPMVLAVAIVAVRRIESLEGVRFGRAGEIGLGVCAAALALVVCLGDYHYAGTARDFAHDARDELQSVEGTVWYDGHLGFQWYMHVDGYAALDFSPMSSDDIAEEDFFNGPTIVLEVAPLGDVLITWQNERMMGSPPEARVGETRVFSYPGSALASTFDSEKHTGFYGKPTALLPYRLGPAPPQEYRVHTLK